MVQLKFMANSKFPSRSSANSTDRRSIRNRPFLPWGRLVGALLSWLLVLLTLVSADTARAHETDNFCLPLDVELADLGDYLEAVHTRALEIAVARVNADIEGAITLRDATVRTNRLRRLHDPLALAKAFHEQFSHPMFEDSGIENALAGRWARQQFAGRETAHQDLKMNFSAHATLDPRRWMMFTQSRTVKAFGVYFGTDKLVHFHHLGEAYYRMYRALRDDGLGREAAYQKVLQHYTSEGILSEENIFGTFSTGVFSNADLAVNHVGFLFFENLTEPVVLKGVEREPLIVRSGVFWRLNRHVRPRSGWLAAFVSDHWNEALNPNLYTPSMRPGIRQVLEERAETIVQFYTRKDGRPDDPAYFDGLTRQLATYHGEEYGHSGQIENLMTIGNTCMTAIHAGSTGAGK